MRSTFRGDAGGGQLGMTEHLADLAQRSAAAQTSTWRHYGARCAGRPRGSQRAGRPDGRCRPHLMAPAAPAEPTPARKPPGSRAVDDCRANRRLPPRLRRRARAGVPGGLPCPARRSRRATSRGRQARGRPPRRHANPDGSTPSDRRGRAGPPPCQGRSCRSGRSRPRRPTPGAGSRQPRWSRSAPPTPVGRPCSLTGTESVTGRAAW